MYCTKVDIARPINRNGPLNAPFMGPPPKSYASSITTGT